MKILIDKFIPYIEGRLEPYAKVEYLLPSDFTAESVKDADALIVRTRTKCNQELLEGSKVKFVATATIGIDHIDQIWCKANGITVSNAPGCNAPAVAQYVWSSLLRRDVRAGRDKIGVVGCGHVGSIVADWGRRLGYEVFVSDPPRQRAGITDSYLELSELLEKCNVVTIHTPLTYKGEFPTYHLFNEESLQKMRPGALLINAARGEVVDNEALLSILKKGDISAIIDTWEGEPEINRQLLELVDIATPHIAGYSEEGKRRGTRMALESLERYFGITIDKTGLTEAYQPPAEINRQAIEDSYDALTDSKMLKATPKDFEKLRSEYNFRKEPQQ